MKSTGMNLRPTGKLELFLLGFATLFLELALIRYLSGNIWNMGYFPNLVLMAVFIGMGIGFVFHNRFPDAVSSRWLQFSTVVLLFLTTFIYWKHPNVPGFNRNAGSVGGEVFYTATPREAQVTDYILF